MIRPSSLHEVAARRAASPETPLATPLCEFLDAFYEDGSDRVAMLAARPVAAISAEEMAYLAAVAEHLSLVYRLPISSWVNRPEYFLDKAFWPEAPGRSAEAIFLAESPVAFRRRFIFTEAEPLRRKHGPRRAAA